MAKKVYGLSSVKCTRDSLRRLVLEETPQHLKTELRVVSRLQIKGLLEGLLWIGSICCRHIRAIGRKTSKNLPILCIYIFLL